MSVSLTSCRLGYDPLGRLTSIVGIDLTAAYTYDGDGNGLAQTVNGVASVLDLDLDLSCGFPDRADGSERVRAT